MGNPLLRRMFGGKIRPGEYYNFWDTHAYGFSETCRDLVRSDVTPLVKKQVRAALEPMLTPSRNRLLRQDHRLAPDGVPERDLRRRQVHSHRARWPGSSELPAPRPLLEWMVRAAELARRTFSPEDQAAWE